MRRNTLRYCALRGLIVAVFLFTLPVPSEAGSPGWRGNNIYTDPLVACQDAVHEPAKPRIYLVATSDPTWYQCWIRADGVTNLYDMWVYNTNAVCSLNQAYNFSSAQCTTSTPPKTLGCSADRGQGNPCDAGTGNKYESEEDVRGGDGAIAFGRYYNSHFNQNLGLGLGWASSVHKRLEIYGTGVTVRQGSGRGEVFTCSNGVCQGDADTSLQLTPDGSGFTLVLRSGTAERYNLAGKLSSETDPSGKITNYFYRTDGKLDYVTDHFGHTLTFGYDANNRVASVTDPSSDPTKAILYSYDGNYNLTRVDYPDDTAKIYHYENTSFPNHLTGISYVDSLGAVTRFSTYEYDATGKAIRTEHAVTDNIGPQEKFTLAYDTDTQTTVTDPVNVKEVMTFQVNLGVKNLITKVNQSDVPLKPLQQAFDLSNNLTCRKDEEGRVSTYTYNTTNQRLSLTEGLAGDCSNPPTSASNTPVTRITNYKYLSPTLDLPTEIKSPSVFSLQSKLTTIGYGNTIPGSPCYGQPLYLPCQITQSGFTPTGSSVTRSVTLGYTNGEVTSVNGPRSPSEPGMNGLDDLTTLEYYNCDTGGRCGQLMKVTNALGHVTTYDLYDLNGRVTQLTDPNGLVTVYEYDPRGRIRFIRQTPPGGTTRVTEYTYWPFGAVKTASLTGSLTPTLTLIYDYDAAQYLRSVTDNAGNQVTYHYDIKGNRDGEKSYDPDGTLVRTITYQSDLRNRLKQITADSSITRLVFDAVGNLRSETDPNNNPSTTHTPDALNRLVNTIDRMNGQTDYDYDVNDRLKQVIAPGASGNRTTTEYQYDDLGNLLKETSPDRGPSSYTYDSAGNVKTMTDARNVLVTYTYDVLNRVTLIDYPFAADDVTFRYDAPGIGEPPCPNGRGRLCRAISQGENQSYGYDRYGNVVDLTHQIGSVSFVRHYSYEAGNRVKTITYPSGMVITYGRDPAGRIQSVTRTDVVPSIPLLSNRQYRADGLVKNQTFGNNLLESRAHDLQGRLLNQFVGNVYARTYPVYDPNGNVKQLFANAFASAFGGNYDYDPLDRLKQDTPTGAGTAHGFDYDGNGNRKLDNAISYIYAPSTNRLSTLGGTSLSYDAAGNIKTDAFGRSYTYDAPGRLKTATVGGMTTTYAYNAFGHRTQKNRQNLPSVYYYTGLNGELLAETDGSGIPIVEYVYADEIPIAQLRYAPDPGGTPAPPSLSGFWPGTAGTGTAVFVFGGGFVTGQTQVSVNGINAPLVQVLTPGLLLFYPPANNLSGPITVTTAQGSVTSSTAFGVPLSGVKILGLSPAQGFVNTVVFVFGSGFVANQTQVSFNQTPTLLVQVLDPGLVLAFVPPGATTGPITVTTPQGSATSSTPFTVWGNGVPAGATITYLHADHLGTPRAGTDQSGVVSWRWEGTGFGETVPQEDPDGDGKRTVVNQRYAGQYFDSETGLFYNWNRYFDPKTGRYISSDPIGLAGGLNTYAYALNNPLRYVDPTGLWSAGFDIYLGFGGGVSVGVDPNTGAPFFNVRAGWGAGGGVYYDPLASAAGSQDNPNGTGGVATGLFAEGNATAAGGGLGASATGGYELGRDWRTGGDNETYNGGTRSVSLGYEPGGITGLRASAAAGLEISIHGPGKKKKNKDCP